MALKKTVNGVVTQSPSNSRIVFRVSVLELRRGVLRHLVVIDG